MKILLAVDDSKSSVAAVSLLIAQAKTKGTEVRLLHVVEPFPVIAAQKKGSRESPQFRGRTPRTARAGQGIAGAGCRKASFCWLQGKFFSRGRRRAEYYPRTRGDVECRPDCRWFPWTKRSVALPDGKCFGGRGPPCSLLSGNCSD